MSTYKTRRKENRESAAAQVLAAVVVEDDPNERLAALAATTAATPTRRGATAEEIVAGLGVPTDRPQLESVEGDAHQINFPEGSPVRRREPSVGEGSGDELVSKLIARAPRGEANSQHLLVRITAADNDRLVAAEEALFERYGRKLVRASLITEAALRVIHDPEPYKVPSGEPRDRTAAISARIADNVHTDLERVSYLSKPRVTFGPMVSEAVIEVLGDLERALLT